MTYVVVRLEGGPRGGRYVKYSAPLPNTLVITELNDEKTGLRYSDYRRSGAKEYRWVDPKTVKTERFRHETTVRPTQPK